MNCPVCGAPAVDVTTHDSEPRWLCVADSSHAEPQAEPQPTTILKKFLGRLLK